MSLQGLFFFVVVVAALAAAGQWSQRQARARSLPRRLLAPRARARRTMRVSQGVKEQIMSNHVQYSIGNNLLPLLPLMLHVMRF